MMELTKTRADYYSRTYILLEIVKQLKYKYLSARKVLDGKVILSRYYMGYNHELLKESLIRLSAFIDLSVKLYFDLAIWDDGKGNTPMFHFEPEKRKIDKQFFDKNYSLYFKGYDFAIDIDAENILDAHRDAKLIKKFLDDRKIPYTLKFSGSKGFHFLIENKWFNDRILPHNKVTKFSKMAEIIAINSGVKSIRDGGTFDDSIYDDRRILKLAYSLVNNNGKEYVCLPLTDEQFNEFKMENMELPYVMKYERIKERGLLTRTHGLSERELKENVANMLRECGQ